MSHSQHASEKQQHATDQPNTADQWQVHLEKISDYSKQLYSDYHSQAKTCKNIAAARMAPFNTLTSAYHYFVGMFCRRVGAALGWLLATIGIAIFAFSESLWLTAGSLIALQLLCLTWLWKNIGYISGKIGFDKSLRSLRQLLNINKDDS